MSGLGDEHSSLNVSSAEFSKWLAILQDDGRKISDAPSVVKNTKALVLVACQQKWDVLRFAAEQFRNDRDVLLAACRQHGWSLQYASEELRNDKDIVLVACQQSGWSLQYAPERLRDDKDIVLAACQQDGWILYYASEALQNDRDVVLAACRQSGSSLQYASEQLRNDRAVVMTAYRQDDSALQYASKEIRDSILTRAEDQSLPKSSKDFSKWLALLRDDGSKLTCAPPLVKNTRELVLAACQQNGNILRHISQEWRSDQQVVLAAFQENYDSIYFASDTLKADPDFMLDACQRDYRAFKYAPHHLKGDKDFLLKICRHCGVVLQFALGGLREDKEVVQVAAASDPDALRYALDGLNQDKDCLIAAGLWDKDYEDSGHGSTDATQQTKYEDDNAKKIVLSTRFALSEGSVSKATQFAILLKQNEYIRVHNFSVFSPNAFGKSSCDPNWTDFNWPCRGTHDTCRMEETQFKTGLPTNDSCWRYSFRHQLEEAKRTNGFMVQLVEAGLQYTRYTSGHAQIPGKGQKIESDMAQQVPTKVFRVYAPIEYRGTKRERENKLSMADVDRLVAEVHKWYAGNCQDMSDCIIPPT